MVAKLHRRLQSDNYHDIFGFEWMSKNFSIDSNPNALEVSNSKEYKLYGLTCDFQIKLLNCGR